ncbi:hypothetical protein DH2020_021397 [Rehmannia glutinosa]|uniref:Small ribosomal subunit protein uS8c n=1 Tax=Rehmannia glutinosa TaxID=99300 RepID=A0ABR0WAZ1_REHGL
MVRVSVLNDALKSMYNAEKRGKRQVMIRPSSKVVIKFLLVMQKHGYIGEFEYVDDHRSGKIVVELNGRLNKCGVISPRFDVGVKEIEPWTARLLPSRQFGYIVLTTSAGIMDHEEARRKNVGGKDKGFWMPKGGGHVTDEDTVFDNTSRMEPKRARQWFLDASEADLFPSKKQVVEAPDGKSDAEISIPNSLHWESSSGFSTVPSQFMDRLFGSETTTPVPLTDRNIVTLTDRNMSIAGTDGSNGRKKVPCEQFENNSSVGLSISYAMEDPEAGVSYGGLRKVKVNQVKDPENGLLASAEHGIGISMEQTYNRGSESTFVSMGQPYGKESENVTLMSHSYDIGEANIRSMGSTFGKGLDNTISMTHSYNKGENNTISFGGYQDESVMEALARPISSYSLLYEQSSAQTSETPSKKEVDTLNATATLSTSHVPKSKVDSTSKNKAETKPARKEAPNSFPSNVRSLIATAFGSFTNGLRKVSLLCNKELRGIIKGTECEFERHAGCKTKHPNNHIYFENGKTIYQIVQELRSTPESMLFDAIQNVTGSPINQKAFRTWKESFQAATRELQRIYGKEELNL